MKINVLALLVLVAFEINARKKYQKDIPNGENVPHWPAVGHTHPNAHPKDRNSFGLDFLEAGKKWTVNLCQMDSDGDGKTNGEELGDPNCVWKVGDTPERTTNITNPGVPEKVITKPKDDTQNTETTTTGSPTNSVDDSDQDSHGEYETWKVVHGLFMALSFGFLLPSAMLIPFFCRTLRSSWRDDHIKVMYVSNSIGVLGFLIAVFSMGIENTPHGIFGVILIIFLILQSFAGYFREKFSDRSFWKKYHSLFGRIILAVTTLQIFLGYIEINEIFPVTAILFGLAHTFVLIVGFILIRRAIIRRESEPSQGIENEEHTELPLESVPAIKTTIQLA